MPIQQLVTPDNFMSITYLNSSKIWHPIFFVKGHGKVIEGHSFRFLSFCYRFALCRVSKDGLIKALDKQNTDFCLNEMIYKKGVSFCSIFFHFLTSKNMIIFFHKYIFMESNSRSWESLHDDRSTVLNS